MSENSSKGRELKVNKIPSKFVNHILSLGFNKEDAQRLYEYKDDWLGINSGGSVRCTEKGCKFTTKHQSDALFEHCRSQHEWADFECDSLTANLWLTQKPRY